MRRQHDGQRGKGRRWRLSGAPPANIQRTGDSPRGVRGRAPETRAIFHHYADTMVGLAGSYVLLFLLALLPTSPPNFSSFPPCSTRAARPDSRARPHVRATCGPERACWRRFYLPISRLLFLFISYSLDIYLASNLYKKYHFYRFLYLFSFFLLHLTFFLFLCGLYARFVPFEAICSHIY